MNTNYLLFSLVLCFCCSACFVTNMSINQSRYYDNEKYHAQYEALLDEGNTIYKANYLYLIEANPNGSYIIKQFNPDKQVLTHYTTYLDKALLVKDGTAIEYWDNKNLRFKGAYSNNKATGTWQYYNFNNGLMSSQGEKVLGEKEGKWTNYSGQDTISSIKNYVNGQLQGESIFYTKAGEIAKKVRYKNGEVVSEEIIIPSKYDEVLETMPYFQSEDCSKFSEKKELLACSQRKMLETIYRNIRYPAFAREMGIEGMVIINFLVDENGNLRKPQVMRGICKELETECLRILPMLDGWVPGKQNNENVKVYFNLPIKFKLE